MINGSRWLAFTALVLVGYLTIHNGWLDFIADQDQVANYLHSHGVGGLVAITLAGSLFTGLGAPRQLLAFVLGFALGGLNGTLLSTLAAAIGATGCFMTARWLLRTPLSRRFSHRMQQFDRLFREQTRAKDLQVRAAARGA